MNLNKRISFIRNIFGNAMKKKDHKRKKCENGNKETNEKTYKTKNNENEAKKHATSEKKT